MNTEKEIRRRDKRIADDKKIIDELKEEIVALRQLLDCAVANLVMLVKDSEGVMKISRREVGEALGKYRLSAKCDDADNYILRVVQENE